MELPIEGEIMGCGRSKQYKVTQPQVEANGEGRNRRVPADNSGFGEGSGEQPMQDQSQGSEKEHSESKENHPKETMKHDDISHSDSFLYIPRPAPVPVTIRIESTGGFIPFELRLTTLTPTYELYKEVRKRLGSSVGGFFLTFRGQAIPSWEDPLERIGIERDEVVTFEGFKPLWERTNAAPYRSL